MGPSSSLNDINGEILVFQLLPRSLTTHPSIIPPRTFLDSESCHPTSLKILPEFPIPPQVLDLVGSKHEIHSTYMRYFSGVHKWLPLLSLKGCSDNILDLGPGSNIGTVLLALSMKLSTSPLGPMEHGLSQLYQETKDLSTKVENCGLLSLQLLQSVVLLAIYEVGHAIHPSAHLSVSRAARLGILLGLHNRNKVCTISKPETWTSREEERRTWWAVLILDRCV